MKNRDRRNAGISISILLSGILLAACPFIADADMMQWGFAAVFIGIFVTMTGMIAFLIYNKRARVYEMMFTEGRYLAKWTYDPYYWHKHIQEDISDFKGGRYAALIIGGIIALIGFIVFLTDPEDENLLFFIIMLGVGILISVISMLALSAQKRRLSNDQGEVVITREGVYFKGELTNWDAVTSHLEAVGFYDGNQSGGSGARPVSEARPVSGPQPVPETEPEQVSEPVSESEDEWIIKGDNLESGRSADEGWGPEDRPTPHERQEPQLVFVYKYLKSRGGGMDRGYLQIPVPHGYESAASKVESFFNMPLTYEMYNEVFGEPE